MISRTCHRVQQAGCHPVASSGVVRRFASSDGTGNDDEKPSIFGRFFGKKKNQAELEADRVSEELYQEETNMIRAMEEEEAQARLTRKRNKSRLHHSDRQMLRGQPPEIGLSMQWCERHTGREFKARMMGQFGRQATGVNPALAWPTKAEMERQADYERVVYEGKSLVERIATHQAQAKEYREEMLAKERDIDEKLATMDKELEVWREKLEKKEREAAKEKAAKDQIFAELRQEFGYNVDPNDPQFADKIAEKEKALAKRQKEEKRKEKAEFKAAKEAAAAASSSSS